MKKIKFFILLVLICVLSPLGCIQKVEVEKEMIQVEAENIGNIVNIKDKENIGLTKTYDFFRLVAKAHYCNN